MSQNMLEEYFTAWNEGDTGYFKIGPIKLSVTDNVGELELMAKDTAKEIEAEVSYAWDLGVKNSDAWWLEWGGYSLEEEIPYYAAISQPEAAEKIENFDPKNNDFECDSVEEFQEMLFNVYDEELTSKDLKRGFQVWLKTLDKEAFAMLKSDLASWTSRAK
ncbi:MAG: hypothetical protein JKY12_07560 [Sneathiella sp.]|nr:hypothetical protein [Sneathiella sp.]